MGKVRLAVSALLQDTQGRLLLIKRCNSPQQGKWAPPGGSVEPGEGLVEAAEREVLEETGLVVKVTSEAVVLRRPDGEGNSFEIHSFWAEVVHPASDASSAVAADDACDLLWATPDDIRTLPLVDGLGQTLADLHIL